jgi:hypothetical protein
MSKEKNKKKMPSIFKMATNFAKDLGKYIKEGAPNVSHKQYTERLEACNTCPNLRKEDMRCTLCGCSVEHKAKWKTTECPDKPSRWKTLFKPLGTDTDNQRKAKKLNKFLHKALDKGLWDPNKPSTANKLFKKMGSKMRFPDFDPNCDTCLNKGEMKYRKTHGKENRKEKDTRDTKDTKEKKNKSKGS